MECSIEYAQHISDIFESMYIYRSIVVCQHPSTMYHTARLLKRLDFPVETVTIFNCKDALYKYANGTARMLIMSEAFARLLMQYAKEVFDQVSVVFCLDGVETCIPPTDDKKIFFFP